MQGLINSVIIGRLRCFKKIVEIILNGEKSF